MLFGALLFSSTQKIHTISRNITLLNDSDHAWLDALSCVNIARLKIFTEAENLVGEYDTEFGTCSIDRFISASGGFILQTSAERGGVVHNLEALVDHDTYQVRELLSLP